MSPVHVSSLNNRDAGQAHLSLPPAAPPPRPSQEVGPREASAVLCPEQETMAPRGRQSGRGSFVWGGHEPLSLPRNNGLHPWLPCPVVRPLDGLTQPWRFPANKQAGYRTLAPSWGFVSGCNKSRLQLKKRHGCIRVCPQPVPEPPRQTDTQTGDRQPTTHSPERSAGPLLSLLSHSAIGKRLPLNPHQVPGG